MTRFFISIEGVVNGIFNCFSKMQEVKSLSQTSYNKIVDIANCLKGKNK